METKYTKHFYNISTKELMTEQDAKVWHAAGVYKDVIEIDRAQAATLRMSGIPQYKSGPAKPVRPSVKPQDNSNVLTFRSPAHGTGNGIA